MRGLHPPTVLFFFSSPAVHTLELLTSAQNCADSICVALLLNKQSNKATQPRTKQKQGGEEKKKKLEVERKEPRPQRRVVCASQRLAGATARGNNLGKVCGHVGRVLLARLRCEAFEHSQRSRAERPCHASLPSRKALHTAVPHLDHDTHNVVLCLHSTRVWQEVRHTKQTPDEEQRGPSHPPWIVMKGGEYTRGRCAPLFVHSDLHRVCGFCRFQGGREGSGKVKHGVVIRGLCQNLRQHPKQRPVQASKHSLQCGAVLLRQGRHAFLQRLNSTFAFVPLRCT